MNAEQMRTVAGLIHQVLSSAGDAAAIDRTRAQVRDLCKQFPVPHE